MSRLFVLARKASDMEFAMTRGRHIKTISEVRRQTKNTITSERKKVKSLKHCNLSIHSKKGARNQAVIKAAK